MMPHHTKFGYKRFSSQGDIIQMNIHQNFDPILWPWPWPQQSNQSFNKLVSWHFKPSQCHQTKFKSCKIISSSENRKLWSFFYNKSLHCDLDLDDSTLIFMKDTFAHTDASPYQVWWKKISCSENTIWTDSLTDSLTFWSFAVTLALNTANQFLHKTLWLMMTYHETKSGCKWMNGYSRYSRNCHILIIRALLWSWTWRQQTNLFAWHTNSKYCITIPSLVIKCLAV